MCYPMYQLLYCKNIIAVVDNFSVAVALYGMLDLPYRMAL